MIGSVAIASMAIMALLIVVALLAFSMGVAYAQKSDGILRGKHAKEFLRRMDAQPRIPIMPPKPHDGNYPVFPTGKEYREAELADHTGERA